MIEIKKALRDDGKLFKAWCNSDECPVGHQTATRMMSVCRSLGKNPPGGIFDQGLRIISEVTQTSDEDIRAALLEHMEKESDAGHHPQLIVEITCQKSNTWNS